MLARLETAIERERTFVDDASHELRTPLALLKTELELALRYETGEGELRAAVVSAREEVDRLIQLAEDLLVVARSVRGRLPIDLARVDVGGLLADVGERFAARVAESGRELRVVEPAEPLERRRGPAPARAGADEPRRQRASPRRGSGDPVGPCGSELHGRAPRRRRGRRVSGRVPAASVRAVQPRRPGPQRWRQRVRARDRRGDRRCASGNGPGGQRSAGRRRRLARDPRLSAGSRRAGPRR